MELIAQHLHLDYRGGGAAVNIELFKRAVETLKLSVRLRVPGPRVQLVHVQPGEALRAEHRLLPFSRVELQPVVADTLPWFAMLSDRCLHRLPSCVRGEASDLCRADRVPGVVIEQVNGSTPSNRRPERPSCRRSASGRSGLAFETFPFLRRPMLLRVD
ncbi:MAG: hypothetical protein LH475_04755 [Cryobacterium sp.]|uniref:hypothetical protein n=1 Tax=Cryobacterium sp. TaxID=1926290 RepID=UPI00229117FB|nr:hypothetical protein [Cryobacterium sp.]MCY7403929.1 hypothetical protein [Cryobacterium sp.]